VGLSAVHKRRSLELWQSSDFETDSRTGLRTPMQAVTLRQVLKKLKLRRSSKFKHSLGLSVTEKFSNLTQTS
jgi:hypothetical protein